MTKDRELKLYNALRRITAYLPPERLRRVSEKQYGLPPEEAIEMAYENVLQEARNALRGIRNPANADASKKARNEEVAA